MESVHQLTKVKSKRYLILSAGGPQSAIQGLYIAREPNAWSILSHALVPYPAPVQTLLETAMLGSSASMSLASLGKLDCAVSSLFLECAKTVCCSTQQSLKQPHAIVLNKLGLWKDMVGDGGGSRNWCLEIGDAWSLASYFKTPVISDFIRHDILRGGSGELPLQPGMCDIVIDNEAIVAHLTIGMLSHLFVFDAQAKHTVIDSDIGPGASLINAAAHATQCAAGFDRDGSLSAQGKVDGRCLDMLASQPCFSTPPPRQLRLAELSRLADHPCLANLSPLDRLATITALTARTTFDFFKKEYKHAVSPQTIWVSGGGANNSTLFEYLKTYFAPLQVRRIDEIGIPAELFVPMALGLTVDALIMGRDGPWKPENKSDMHILGTWIVP